MVGPLYPGITCAELGGKAFACKTREAECRDMQELVTEVPNDEKPVPIPVPLPRDGAVIELVGVGPEVVGSAIEKCKIFLAQPILALSI